MRASGRGRCSRGRTERGARDDEDAREVIPLLLEEEALVSIPLVCVCVRL